MAAENGVTSASEWGAGNVEVVELPSGETAKLKKKLNIWTLFRRGVMTPELLAAYEKAEKGQLDDIGMAVELNDLILSEMFVEPKVFVPDDEKAKVPADQVHVDLVDDTDVTFVLERAFRGARDVAGFRGETGGAGAGADRKGVGEDAGGADGDGAGDAPGVPVGQKARSSARGKRTAGKRKPAAKKK